jgi:hypothetical protein
MSPPYSWSKNKPNCFTLVSCLAYPSTPKMEARCSSETSVAFQRTTRSYIAEYIRTPQELRSLWERCSSEFLAGMPRDSKVKSPVRFQWSGKFWGPLLCGLSSEYRVLSENKNEQMHPFVWHWQCVFVVLDFRTEISSTKQSWNSVTVLTAKRT